MIVALGSDHAGFEIKDAVRRALEKAGHEVLDLGAASADCPDCDYPDYARPVAEAVAGGRAGRGVLVCGTGIGMSIVANRLPGVRAALCHDRFTAEAARRHNDANVLCLGGRVLPEGTALDLVEVFMRTPFVGGRHARRVGKIDGAGKDGA